MCVELDFPRHRLSSCCHYIGSLAAARPDTVDFPWEKLDGRPLIYVSLGTLPGTENLSAYRKITEACAGIEAQLVLGLGKWRTHSGTVADELGQLPGDPILVGFAPQTSLLERASLLIGHAGLNSVLEALIHGVPMVLLPRFADHPGMAARVVHAGAGLRGSYTGFTANQLRPMIQRLLGDNKFRERAETLGRALHATGGVIRAADIVERVLETGRPVARDDFYTKTSPAVSGFGVTAR
jgi:MGT family glycosyltransferase